MIRENYNASVFYSEIHNQYYVYIYCKQKTCIAAYVYSDDSEAIVEDIRLFLDNNGSSQFSVNSDNAVVDAYNAADDILQLPGIEWLFIFADRICVMDRVVPMAKRKAWYALFTRFGISEYPRNAKCFSC
jgi:hypothetical protein